MTQRRPQYKAKTPRHRQQYSPPDSGAACTPQYEAARRIRSGRKWVALMRAIKRQRPVCEWCGERPTEQGHHRKPVAEHPELALDADNVLAVCTKCHELIESAIRRGIDLDAILED